MTTNSLDAARSKAHEIAARILTITTDTTLSDRQKIARAEKLYETLEAAEAEVHNLQFVANERKRIFGSGGPTAAGSAYGGDIPLSGTGTLGLFQAPAITPSDEQTHDLWRALSSRKGLRLDVGHKGEPGIVPLNQGQPAYRVSAPLGLPTEPTRVLDHVPVTATTAPVVEYLRVESITGSAEIVAAGQPKPELTMTSSTPSLTIPKIAAFIRVVDEVLADYAGFQGFVTGELRRAVIDAENDMLLNGAGGLNNTTGLLTRDQDTDSLLDAVEQAYADLRIGAAYVSPDLVVAHPTDFSAIRRSKDQQDRYLLSADPSAAEASTLWGVPVLQSTQQPRGILLVGNFAVACRGWVRQGLVIDALSSGEDWTNNVTAIRCEERVGIAATRPAAIVKLTLTPPAGG